MRALDALDVKLFGALYGTDGLTPVNPNVRASFQRLARRFGTSEGTIRNRARNLSSAGVVRGLRLIPNPVLLGLGETNFMVDVPTRVGRQELVNEIQTMDGVVIVASFHAGWLSVIVAHRSEAEMLRQIEQLMRLTGVERPTLRRLPFPPCALRLGAGDWAVLRALHQDPWKDISAVGREIGVPGPSVGKRLKRMLEANAAFVWAQIEPCGGQVGVFGTIVVDYDLSSKARADQEISTIVDRYLFSTFPMLPFAPGGPTSCGFNLILPNIPMGRDLRIKVQKIPGVSQARFEVFEQILYDSSVFEAALQRAPIGPTG